MGEVTFRVFGPVDVLRDGVPVPALGRTTTNLLAALLLSVNDVIPVAALIDRVWDAYAPTHPRAALHSGIARLRRLLGGDVLETHSWGYRLRSDPDHHDLLRFDQLERAASLSLRNGRPEAALDSFDAAIALVREPLLGNVDSPVLQRQELPRLVERQLRLVEARAELALRLGRDEAAVVHDLSTVMRAHPFHERTAGLLMTALLRGNRRPEALRVYDNLRRSLSEELGIDPGEALRDLQLRILRGEPR